MKLVFMQKQFIRKLQNIILLLLQIVYLLPFSEKVTPNSRKTALATTVQVARIRRQLPRPPLARRVKHVRLNISLCCTSFYAMLVKRTKIILGSGKLRILSSFRFEALRKVQVYLLVSAGKIFQLFEANGKFWKIKMIDQTFSQRTSAGRFGTTFSTKGGDNLKNLLLVSPFRQKVTMKKRNSLNSNFEFNLNTEVLM